MPRPSIWRERNFDRGADFVVNRPIHVNGGTIAPGQSFDKTLVSTRTLRQLYEQRKIEFAVGAMPGAPPARSLKSVRERNAAIVTTRSPPVRRSRRSKGNPQ